jgi:outer membrane lipoprotein
MKLWQQYVRWSWLMVLAFTAVGCSHVISDAVRQQVDTQVTFQALHANPEAFKGRIVLFGGQIVETQNTQEGTVLEVVQKPLDSYDRPALTDYSEGRFMALCDRYLDAAVYTKDRGVTVAGRVLGARAGQIGEMQYTYPLLSCLELHLWPQVMAIEPRYGVYPWWYWEPWPWDYWRWRRYPYPYWRSYGPYWWW